MPTSAARWSTTSVPWTARRTLSRSATSPVSTSTSRFTGELSSQPHDPEEVYRTRPRTRAPSVTSRSARWLPMNPPAPVTRTVLPLHGASADANSHVLDGVLVVGVLPNVPPVFTHREA